MADSGHATGPVVVEFPDEFDFGSAGDVAVRLRAATAAGVSVVVADLTTAAFCGSSGVRIMLLARDWAGAGNAGLRLAVRQIAHGCLRASTQASLPYTRSIAIAPQSARTRRKPKPRHSPGDARGCAVRRARPVREARKRPARYYPSAGNPPIDLPRFTANLWPANCRQRQPVAA